METVKKTYIVACTMLTLLAYTGGVGINKTTGEVVYLPDREPTSSENID